MTLPVHLSLESTPSAVDLDALLAARHGVRTVGVGFPSGDTRRRDYHVFVLESRTSRQLDGLLPDRVACRVTSGGQARSILNAPIT